MSTIILVRQRYHEEHPVMRVFYRLFESVLHPFLMTSLQNELDMLMIVYELGHVINCITIAPEEQANVIMYCTSREVYVDVTK